jgi:hypothetical protein
MQILMTKPIIELEYMQGNIVIKNIGQTIFKRKYTGGMNDRTQKSNPAVLV